MWYSINRYDLLTKKNLNFTEIDMKKTLMIAGILIIVLLAVLEFVAGINERAFSRILEGIFLFVVGTSYFFEIRK